MPIPTDIGIIKNIEIIIAFFMIFLKLSFCSLALSLESSGKIILDNVYEKTPTTIK